MVPPAEDDTGGVLTQHRPCDFMRVDIRPSALADSQQTLLLHTVDVL